MGRKTQTEKKAKDVAQSAKKKQVDGGVDKKRKRKNKEGNKKSKKKSEKSKQHKKKEKRSESPSSSSEDEQVEKRPYYPIGTILVTQYSDGRNRGCVFYKVVAHTKTKAPKVLELVATSENVTNEILEKSDKVKPTEVARGDVKEVMRWYSTCRTYLTKEDGVYTRHSASYAITEIYDPNKTYMKQWLSA
jgi:hypothetical protein